MYIIRRGSLYHFSRKLPDSLRGKEIPLASGPRKVGTNGYLRFSLGTGNRQEAERLARRIAVEVDEFLAAKKAAWERIVAPSLEKQGQPQGVILKDIFDQLPPDQQAKILEVARPVPRPTFSPEEIEKAARLMYATILQQDEHEYRELVASLLAPDSDGKDTDERWLMPRENPFFVGKLPPPGLVGDVELLKALKPFIAQHLHLATGRDTSFWRLGEGYEPFAAAFRAVSRDLKRRQKGEEVPTPPVPEIAVKGKPTFGWQELLEYWIRDCPRHPRTVREMQTLVQALSEFLRGKLPADMSKQDVTAWLRHERDSRGNSGKTLEKKGTLVGALFSVAVKDDLLPSNPFAGFDYKRLALKIGVQSESGREPFSLAQLQTLFSAEGLFAQSKGNGGGGYYARVWIPLLGLFTGARLDELGRLTVDDIQREPVPHFRIRRAKNSESLRSVPLHPQLIEHRLLDYVEAIQSAGHTRLWPLLRSRGALHTDSEMIGRWFNRYVHERLGFPRTVVFHSLRHTFKDLCRNAGIVSDVHHQLTGHASGSVGDRYGEGYSLEVLHTEISKIRLPFTVPRPEPYIPDQSDAPQRRATRHRNDRVEQEGPTEGAPPNREDAVVD